MPKDCTTCVHFKSFRADCFGDQMEPDDQGYCKCGESIYYGNEGAGYDVVCLKHKDKNA